MKHLIIVAIATLFFTACQKDGGSMLRPDAKLALNAATSKAETNPEHLTARELVEKTTAIHAGNDWDRGFASEQRDFVNNRLMMWGSDVITGEGTLSETFISMSDVVLEHWPTLHTPEWVDEGYECDTIAYIPNAVLRQAETKIRAAYAAENYDEVYKLFNDAYTFYPITGAEWRALKAQGEN